MHRHQVLPSWIMALNSASGAEIFADKGLALELPYRARAGRIALTACATTIAGHDGLRKRAFSMVMK